MRFFTPRALFVFALTLGLGTPVLAAEGELARQDDESGGVLLAAARKKKKKKRKAGEDPLAAGGGGAGAHGAQENDEKAYTWQLSVLSDFKIVNTKTEDVKGGTANYDLDFLALYVIGANLEAGGGLTYSEDTTKFEDGSIKNSAYLLKLRAVYNFNSIQKDEFVFFVGLGGGFGSTSAKSGDGDPAKGSITQFGVGAGLHFFMDSNVALTGEFSYDMGTQTQKVGEESVKSDRTELHLAKIGFSLFI